MAGYAFPWILLLLVPGAGPHASTREIVPTRRPPTRGFVWAWLLVPLAVFSLAGNKGDYYMVVGMPPLTLILALRLDAACGLARVALVPALAMAMLAAAIAVLARHPVYELPAHTSACVA